LSRDFGEAPVRQKFYSGRKIFSGIMQKLDKLVTVLARFIGS
jgi:hypothetical protein